MSRHVFVRVAPMIDSDHFPTTCAAKCFRSILVILCVESLSFKLEVNLRNSLVTFVGSQECYLLIELLNFEEKLMCTNLQEEPTDLCFQWH